MAMIGGDSIFSGAGIVIARTSSVITGRDRLELGQHLEARLRLPRLGRLGAEAVDERLQMLALGFLLLGELLVERLAFAALAFEMRNSRRGRASACVWSRCRMQSTALSSRSRSWLMMIMVRGYRAR